MVLSGFLHALQTFEFFAGFEPILALLSERLASVSGRLTSGLLGASYFLTASDRIAVAYRRAQAAELRSGLA